jgi:hypothetical protein
MELGDFHATEPWTKWEVHNGLNPFRWKGKALGREFGRY